MSPDKKQIVNGQKVEKYYWAGEYPVYVDNNLVTTDFEETVASLERGEEPRWARSGTVGAAEAMARLLSNADLTEAYRNAKAAEGDAAERAKGIFGREIVRRTMGRSQNVPDQRAAKEGSQNG